MSPRYAWPAAVLLLVALVPTAANVYRSPAREEPGRLARELPELLPGFPPPTKGRHDADWSETYFGTRESLSRHYGELELFAARTRDAKKLFHFPELALTYGRSVTSMRRVQVGRSLPAQRLDFVTSQGTQVALYALFCGTDPVSDPYGHLVAEFPALLLGDHKPWTLVYAQGRADAAEVEDLAAQLGAMLAAACAELAR